MDKTALDQLNDHQQTESSAKVDEASVADAAKNQLHQLKADAEKMLAELKEQEQQKLKQALASVKAQQAADNQQNINKAQAQNAEYEAKAEQADFVQRVDEQQKQVQKKAADQQLAMAQEASSGTPLDELILEGNLLHPLKGLEKIQGVHEAQLDVLLEQINATLETTQPEQSQ